MKYNVSAEHPQYSEACKRWKLIRAITDNCAQEYIRNPDLSDSERSKQYKQDAILTNFTKFTELGLNGLIFREEPKVSLPSGVEYLMDNFTGTGVNLWQASQSASSENIKMGRIGFLVDQFDNGYSFIKPYVSESIKNWKTKLVNGETVLSLLTLVEYIVKDDLDPFSQETAKQYRVLRLSDDNIYFQEIYNEDEELIAQIEVTDYNGNYFDRIQFFFAGSVNNDWEVDYQPLYDLAVLNLGHYRNSADYEESVFICGQPYLHIDIGDTDEESFKSNNEQGINFGSRKALITMKGNAQLLQASPNQLVAQAMKEKIEQAASIGARLIERAQGTRETAEGARIRYGSQSSALQVLTNNLSWAIKSAIKAVCRFRGVDDSTVEFELNTQFYDENADPNMANSLLTWWQNGLIGKSDLQEYGRKTGFIDKSRTDEDIDLEAEIQDPLGGADAGSNTTSPTTPNEAG